jgi:hypothetical protein
MNDFLLKKLSASDHPHGRPPAKKSWLLYLKGRGLEMGISRLVQTGLTGFTES